jgi:hypothetical protein
MGKTIFAAVVAAVLASIATVLVMDSFKSETAAAEAKDRQAAAEVAKVERERIERRITDLEKRAQAARPERRGSGDGDVAATLPAPPPGSVYVTRAELDEILKTVRANSSANNALVGAESHTPIEKKALEDIARDMNLTAGEEANLRNILRESEEEMIRNLFGDRPFDEIKREVQEAKDDPDKLTALMQGVVQNGIANVGRLMTLENRTKKRVTAVLGADRAKVFMGKPRKPVIDAELHDALDTLDK